MSMHDTKLMFVQVTKFMFVQVDVNFMFVQVVLVHVRASCLNSCSCKFLSKFIFVQAAVYCHVCVSCLSRGSGSVPDV